MTVMAVMIVLMMMIVPMVMIVLMVMMMVQETDGNQGSTEASGGDVQVGERR